MQILINIPEGQTEGTAKVVQAPIVSAVPRAEDAPQAQDFPLFIPKYNHRFNSLAELQDYERRLAEREANLSGATPAEHSIVDLPAGSTTTLPAAQSKAFRIGSNDAVAFAIDVPEGTKHVRVGVGEYKSSPAHYELALSRQALQFEDAPLRGTQSMNVDMGPEGNLFTSGPWFINVKKAYGGAEGDTTTSFVISWYFD